MGDLPRLAEGTTAEGFADVQKLLDVRIENGWVHATLPKAGDDECWWNPWEKYYSNPGEPPFLQLLQCGSSDRSVVSFLQSHGAIVKYRHGVEGRIAFPVALFHFEKWQFSFVARLLSDQRPDNFRRVFTEQLSDAGAALHAGAALQKSRRLMERGPWERAVRRVWYAVNRQDPPLRTSSSGCADWTPVLNALRSNLTKMKPADIQIAARRYITDIVMEKIGNLRLAFERGANDWRLYAHSDDLLEGFYWMLADYFAGQKRLSSCAVCGTVFVGSGRYCPTKVKCKELGRRKLDWEKNKAKYNRTRRLKRQKNRTDS
jgi:hypothetical protein